MSNYKIQQICGGNVETICVSAKKSSYLMSDVFPSQKYSFAIKSCCSSLDKTCESELSHPFECTTKGKIYMLVSFQLLTKVKAHRFNFNV